MQAPCRFCHSRRRRRPRPALPQRGARPRALRPARPAGPKGGGSRASGPTWHPTAPGAALGRPGTRRTAERRPRAGADAVHVRAGAAQKGAAAFLARPGSRSDTRSAMYRRHCAAAREVNVPWRRMSMQQVICPALRAVPGRSLCLRWDEDRAPDDLAKVPPGPRPESRYAVLLHRVDLRSRRSCQSADRVQVGEEVRRHLRSLEVAIGQHETQ